MIIPLNQALVNTSENYVFLNKNNELNSTLVQSTSIFRAVFCANSHRYFRLIVNIIIDSLALDSSDQDIQSASS
ncbi:hypothetical protein EBI00_14410 [Marinomonas hwangdonensis]|uniref:Uncharacterized protein n=1 Tax=Marinomonas hwangdonensis TaxID=1053647 RepID=A0A3M8PY22_9GAMM|nr:hypothetical protein EBI00_14410 [Marinomonas hwangdonensis]